MPGLGAPAVSAAEEPRPASLTLAVGRTWSGNVFSALAPVAVVGGPLRTGRTTEIARVIRIGLAPHDAIDRWIFSGNRNLVRDVYVGGRRVVQDGHHVQRAAIAARYRAAVAKLMAE